MNAIHIFRENFLLTCVSVKNKISEIHAKISSLINTKDYIKKTAIRIWTLEIKKDPVSIPLTQNIVDKRTFQICLLKY